MIKFSYHLLSAFCAPNADLCPFQHDLFQSPTGQWHYWFCSPFSTTKILFLYKSPALPTEPCASGDCDSPFASPGCPKIYPTLPDKDRSKNGQVIHSDQWDIKGNPVRCFWESTFLVKQAIWDYLSSSSWHCHAWGQGLDLQQSSCHLEALV